MRVRYSIVIALVSVLAITSSVANANTGFVVSLSGLNEVPPNASPASGTAFAVLDNTGTILTYSVTYSGLLAPRTASHFHAIAAPGANASVQLPIAAGGPTSDSFSGSGAVNATLLTGLTTPSGDGSVKVYLNVHSSQFPGGEIRGQLVPDATPTHNVSWGRIKALYR